MPTRHFVTLVFLTISTISFSQLEYDIEDGYVKVYDYLNEFDLLDTVGTDGVRILFPDSWELGMGEDGRMITYPEHWGVEDGGDGRVVAFPYDWKTNIGDDGRMVSIPNYQIGGETRGRWVKKKKSPNCHSVNPDDCYIACYEEPSTGYDWDWAVGSDDRLIVITTDFNRHLKTDGKGRKLIVPTGWKVYETSSGQSVVAPPYWELEEYEDESYDIIPPFKSVETIGDIVDEEDNLLLVFKQPYKTVLLQKIKTSNAEEALDVALYWFFNGY